MQVFQDTHSLKTALSPEYCAGSTIGFVPTMGALHAGHAALMGRAASENAVSVASIFVNPTQFGPKEDLAKYPRTLEADLEICKAQGITHVFCPNEAVMYPEGRLTHELLFGLRNLDKVLCGASRPGHFNGVVQVVGKLFNIVQPTHAYFGEKDFQQLTILRTLVAELFFPVEIVACAIVREEDGLAMSSRNRYLQPEERVQALFLSRCLQQAQAMAKEGLPVEALHAMVSELLKAYPLARLDYFDVRGSHRLEGMATLQAELQPRAFVAAFLGSTRLIDNAPLLG